MKGFCDEFSPATGQVQVSATPNSTRESRVIVSLKQLKAVFFVHDLEGGAARQGAQNPREAGRRIDVTFVDGELLSGTTLSYSRDGVGFFVYPADAHSNNSRTFVVSAPRCATCNSRKFFRTIHIRRFLGRQCSARSTRLSGPCRTFGTRSGRCENSRCSPRLRS